MKSFNNFYPDLLPLVPGCPEPVADQALKRAAQRFCELTLAWRVKFDSINLSAGTDEYELPLADLKAELVRIEIARLGTCDIAIATQNDVNRHRPYVDIYDGKMVVVSPTPTAIGVLDLTCTLKPSNKATGVEDSLFDRYAEVIATGAAGMLKQHALKTYTDAQGAVEKTAQFTDRCNSIKLRLWRGNARNTPRTVPSWF